MFAVCFVLQLGAALLKRPDKSELVSKSIHKGGSSGRLQGPGAALKRKIFEDKISVCLRTRPTLEEVLSSGIMHKLHDDGTMKGKLQKAMATSMLTKMLTVAPRSPQVAAEREAKAKSGQSSAKRMGHLLVAANKSGDLEKAVQKMEEETKPAAVAAESVSAPVEGVAGSLYASDTKEFQPYSGFVEKRNKFGMWQKRFFELCTHYLSYYKTADKEKVLGTIDLCAVRCGRL